MIINVKKIVNESDIFELLKLAFSIDEDAVKKQFKNYGIILDSLKDLEALAALHLNGGDVAGILKDKKGNPIKFNIREVLVNTKSNFGDKYLEKKLNLIWE